MLHKEVRERVCEGGFPSVSGPVVKLGWAQYVNAIEMSRTRVRGEVRQKELQKAILDEINRVLDELGQYNATEREFVVRVTAQEGMIPKGYDETMSWHVMPYANEVEGRRALEIGFGDGRSFCFFNDWDYLGLEASPRAIYYARKDKHANNKRIKRTQEGKNFPLEDGTIDFILANNSMQAIRDWEFELDECVRALKTGGRLFFIERLGDGGALPNIERFNPDYNSPEQLAGYLREKGMSVETQEVRGTYRGEVMLPDGFFRFMHIKGVKE